MQRHEQQVLTWLIDHKAAHLETPNEHRRKLIALVSEDASVWLKEVNNAIDNYLHLKKLADQLVKFTQDDSPPQTSLLPVIKKLINMLGSDQGDSLMPVWTLALKTLSTIKVAQLVESQILEALIDAFLASNNKIQQTTFTQLLRISETIASNDKNGLFLCKLIFKILNSIKTNKNT